MKTMIEVKHEGIEGTALVPESALERMTKQGWKPVSPAEQAEEQGLEPPADAPARSATKGDWVTYATAEDRGAAALDAETAESMTRDGLAEHFLGPKA